jgi:hypothetical protein
MTRDEYWDDLMIALRANDVDGRQLGQIIAELAAHLEDSDSDPRTELGDPFDLAEALAGRRGPAPSTRVRFGAFLFAFLSAVVGLFGLVWPEAGVGLSVSWSELVAVVLAIGGWVWWGSLLFARTSVDLARGTSRVSDRFLAFGLIVVAGLPVLAAALIPDTEAFVGSRTLWWSILLVGLVYVTVELVLARGHRLITLPSDSPHEAKLTVDRLSGMTGMVSGWRAGRRYRNQ